MRCAVHGVVFCFLWFALAEPETCPNGHGRHGCSESQEKRHQRKILRGLLRKGGAVLGDVVISEDRSTCVASKSIQKGDLLFEIPLTVVRRSAQLPHFSGLSLADRLVLSLAILMKEFEEAKHAKHANSPLAAYAGYLAMEPLPNATVLWPHKELAWLIGTEAHQMTEHFLRRISQIHAAAPLVVDHHDVKVAFVHFYTRHLKLPLGAELSAFRPLWFMPANSYYRTYMYLQK
eukprot:Skav222929  [mRNA]  locus=scaffold1489:383495:384299:+ [translate_table: standard]